MNDLVIRVDDSGRVTMVTFSNPVGPIPNVGEVFSLWERRYPEVEPRPVDYYLVTSRSYHYEFMTFPPTVSNQSRLIQTVTLRVEPV